MQLIHILSFLIFHTGYRLIQGDFNTCQTSNSCSECISNGPNCAWCLDLHYNKTIDKVKSYYKKCDLESIHKSQGCKSISNPKSSAEIIETSPLKGDTRVSPKVIKINLRPGQPTDVSIRIKTPKNFPIDLYYLMDLSKSMKDDLVQIRKLADKLAVEMLRVSKNFRLGFGAFVDKPLGPYTFTKPEEIDSMITKFLPGSQYTFGFKNYLPLNENTSKFKETIASVKYSFNVDGPEGSLEALMQVLVCEKAIGWRDKRKARRIVIITTDQTFHYAGDGLIGGVVIPNDATCQLKNDDYTGWDKYDYPSLSQIRSTMIDNQIVPIFATLGNEELYTEVTKFFGARSGAVAQRLANDSSNVVPLVKESYEKIAKIVSIHSTAPDGVIVKFSTNCGAAKKTPVEADFCDNVAIGQEVAFRTTLLAKDCKLDSKGEVKFKLKTDFDDVEVNMKMLCACGCGETTVVNSPDCHSRGNLTCGQCTCNKGFAGRFCQCTAIEAKNETLCRVPGISGKICSGVGKCECGECSCNQVDQSDAEDGIVEYIYGSQCQCTNTGCRRSNGLVCGGPDHGTCDCGKCKCNVQWTGIACDRKCIKSEEACLGKDKLICGGKGSCACNKCQCNDGYIGNLCQECVANCPDPCSDYKKCVQCLVFDTSELTQEECDIECAANNITKDYKILDKIPEDKSRCIARDKDDCSFVFTYNKNNVTGVVQIIVQQERICPAEADILAIILGVIAGIVGIGLALLLIWKLLATIQDRREFAKFDKDRQHPKWDSGENPIYKGATSTFQNPMFDTKSKSQNPES